MCALFRYHMEYDVWEKHDQKKIERIRGNTTLLDKTEARKKSPRKEYYSPAFCYLNESD